MSQFNYVQSAGSAFWTITHNLGTNAEVIDVFVNNAGTLEKILPLNIVHVDANHIVVSFSTNYTGYARIVA